MPSPQQSDSLRALMGLGSNTANSRTAIRQTQLADPRTTDSFRRMVNVEDANEEALRGDDPYDEIGQAQDAETVYNLPETRGMREDQRAYEIERATAPARTQGQYAVQAAGNKAAAQNDALRAMLTSGMQPGQRVSVSGVGSVSTPAPKVSQAAQAQRQYLQSLRTGKAHAPRPAGEGWLDRTITGPRQQDLDQSEMNRVMAGLESGADSTQGGGDVREQVSAALQAQGIDPNLVDEVMSDPQAMAELGF